MNLLLKYGWYFILIAVIGEMIIPIILAPFYKGYRPTTMAISTLGNEKSPVRLPFNLWMLAAGVLLLLSIPVVYNLYREISAPLSFTIALFIGLFAVGACILSCFFSVSETKNSDTTASKIHGAGSALGFTLLLFVPLLLTILSFKAKDSVSASIALVSFILALLFFVLFVMADKPELQHTIIAKEGLWQRLTLLFMYAPLGYLAIKNILYQA